MLSECLKKYTHCIVTLSGLDRDFILTQYQYINAYAHHQTKRRDPHPKQWLDKIIGDKRVLCEMTDLSHQYETVCSGVGVAGLPCFLADRDKRLVKLEVDESMLSHDIWIAKHPDCRSDPLVVHVSNVISMMLKKVGLGLK